MPLDDTGRRYFGGGGGGGRHNSENMTQVIGNTIGVMKFMCDVLEVCRSCTAKNVAANILLALMRGVARANENPYQWLGKFFDDICEEYNKELEEDDTKSSER